MLTRRMFAGLGLGALGSTITGSAQASRKGPFEITLSEAEWRKRLTPQQYYILREEGTERAFTSPLDKNYADGTYHCAGCELALFSSEHKYDSRTGWPSFWQPLQNAVGYSTDYKLFYPRTEVHCRRCGGHLGHVFDDGPPPTGKRYCMNGLAMTFKPKTKSES
ncbi:MAG: peptide-methionine (R)-S-oxide reductase MsrB [Pseudomonadota bacterium]